jgi:hypothetical protein
MGFDAGSLAGAWCDRGECQLIRYAAPPKHLHPLSRVQDHVVRVSLDEPRPPRAPAILCYTELEEDALLPYL